MKKFYRIGTPIFFLLISINSGFASFTSVRDRFASGYYPESNYFVREGTCETTITLSSQAEVNAFPSNYGCQVVNKLVISGSDITNLDSLYALTKTGDLEILNTSLTDLNGLSHLVYLGDVNCASCVQPGLTIMDNPLLSSLLAFSSVQNFQGSLRIINNSSLLNLDGLSAITSLTSDYRLYESLIIRNNSSLLQINALHTLTNATDYLRIEDNASLQNIDGLSALQRIVTGSGRAVGITIANNSSLQNIDGLASLSKVQGQYASLVIDNNSQITDIDGLSAITVLDGGYSSALRISNNVLLTNLDGLSSLTALKGVATFAYLGILNNPVLASGCGIFPILISGGVGGTDCIDNQPQCGEVEISGNGEVTYESIMAAGPCSDPEPATQATDLVFANVTSSSMKVSFTPTSELVKGYVVLMRAFGASAPEEIPVDGTVYSTGNVIGSSSIVVYNGPGHSFSVTGLLADTNYFFDVFTYNFSNNYRTISPLEGSRKTLSDTPPSLPTLSFSDVTDNSMTVSLNGNVPVEYVALMKAFSSPAPDDYPMNGTRYHVGDVIGSGTIVVHTGSDSTFTVGYLNPGTAYYFDVFAFYPDSFTYDTVPQHGNQITLSETSLTTAELARPYPNPFEYKTTIPFHVNASDKGVHIAIFDYMGAHVTDIANGQFSPGYHEANWDGSDRDGKKMKTGFYVYRIVSGNRDKTIQGRLMLK